MDEITCRITRPKTLSYQNMIEKSTKKVNITSIFRPNALIKAEFYVWDQSKSLADNDKSFYEEKKDVNVCLTRVSPDDQNNEESLSRSLPKFHISITKDKPDDYKEKSPMTNKINFLTFLINQDYMVNPTIVEITNTMGCPYHIILKVKE